MALCAQTLQFLDDRPGALAEIHRILRPGGRLAVSLWCDIRESPYFHALTQAVAENIGADTAGGLLAAFGLSEAHRIRDLLTGAGFMDVEAHVAKLELPLPEAKHFGPRHVRATPMAAGFDGASEEAREAVAQQVADRLGPYETGPGSGFPFPPIWWQASERSHPPGGPGTLTETLGTCSM